MTAPAPQLSIETVCSVCVAQGQTCPFSGRCRNVLCLVNGKVWRGKHYLWDCEYEYWQDQVTAPEHAPSGRVHIDDIVEFGNDTNVVTR